MDFNKEPKTQKQFVKDLYQYNQTHNFYTKIGLEMNKTCHFKCTTDYNTSFQCFENCVSKHIKSAYFGKYQLNEFFNI